MDGTEDAQVQMSPLIPTSNPRNVVKPPHPGAQLKRWLKEYCGSLIFLWLPTVLAAIYYFFIAADLFASETKFVVRSLSRGQVSPLTNLLQSTGITKAQDDVYSVNDFVISRDAVKVLNARLPLREIFGWQEADILARYPNPLYDSSEEDFFAYYKKRVAVGYDATTGITTVTVKAFRADDARKIAHVLIEESEALVNRLNQRARTNAVADAAADVKRAEERVLEAQQRTLSYRTREELLDPGKSSGALFETVAKLKAELTLVQTRLAEMQKTSPDSPLASGLQTRAGALQRQIQNEQAKLAGGDGSIAPKLPEYEQLMLQQEFAAKGLASAMASMEAAREEARRQQIYLDRVIEPSAPDKAEFPKRLKSILIIFVSCFLAYSTGKLLLAGIREHAQV